MREIKFRAWDKIEEVMCDVDVMSFSKGCFLYGNSPSDWSIQQNGKVMVHSEDGDKGHFVSFENMILMQYTGLKDKNGVEIYEGDIIQWIYGCGSSGRPDPIGKVIFNNKTCSFKGKVNNDNYGKFSLDNENDYKIIGNIYKNPELITEEL